MDRGATLGGGRDQAAHPIRVLTSRRKQVEFELVAEVAEMADALRSGRSGRKAVGVQLPASALTGQAGPILFVREVSQRISGQPPGAGRCLLS